MKDYASQKTQNFFNKSACLMSLMTNLEWSPNHLSITDLQSTIYAPISKHNSDVSSVGIVSKVFRIVFASSNLILFLGYSGDYCAMVGIYLYFLFLIFRESHDMKYILVKKVKDFSIVMLKT